MAFSWLKLRNAIRLGEETIPEVSVATPPKGEVKVVPAPEPELEDDTLVIDMTDEVDHDQTPIQPSHDPQDTVEQASKDARRYIEQVRPLSVLIGRTEGTAKKRGYNETLAYGAYTGGDVELVRMILPTIDALQTRMLAHPKNKWNSSAIGYYQVVRTTLRALKKKWGFENSQLFDEQFQDDLFYILLVGRGLVRWRKGEISTLDFVDALSKEWASLPNRNGRGSYGGQHAGCTLDELLAVLKIIK